MDLNVQTLSQIGGALQKLNADGTLDEAGTQQMTAALAQQLGSNFTQMTLTDHLHTDFVKEGGGLPTFVVMAIAIAASIATSGAAAAAMGATLTTMTLGESIAVAALSGMAGSAASQLASGQGLNFGALLEAGAIAAITAGLTNGITYNGTTGEFGLNGLSQGLNSLPAGTSTLGQLAGLSNIGNALGQITQAGATAASSLPSQLAALGATAVINAGVQTAIEGGSFLNDLKGAGLSDLAALGAYEIGGAQNTLTKDFGTVGGELAYVGLHSALGCAASALGGTGCAGGAMGGATSALVAPLIRDGLYNGTQTVTTTDNGDGTLTRTTSYNDSAFNAITVGLATLAGGLTSGLAGANAQAGATAAENEALNNATSTKTTKERSPDAIQPVYPLENLLLGSSGLYRLASAAVDVYNSLVGSSSVVPKPGNTTVYISTSEDGTTQYVGITDDVEARAAAHLSQKGIEIDPIPGLQGISRDDARAVEQVLIEYNGLGKSGGSLLNKINSIARTNPIYAGALTRGRALLQSVGYPGFK
jgi:filamentous hemagglutinin